MTGSMESVRPVTAITGSNKFRALAEFLNFRFSDAIKPVFVALDRCAALKNVEGAVSLIHFASGASVWCALAAGGTSTLRDR